MIGCVRSACELSLLAGRIASWWLASTRAEVLVAPEHNLDGITPARLFGGRAAIFLCLYLRKL